MSLSTTARQALFAQETGEAFIILLTIDHPNLAAPIRVAGDGLDVISRGDTFVAMPFDLSLPEQTEDRPPRARLAIDNVSRDIVKAVRSISSPATVLIEIVLASDPNTVEASLPDFILRDVRYDALVVEGDLDLEDFAAEPYPAAIFSPANFPGLF
ncbi:MAG: DUF1833 family protein [Kiloniellaceae bacterium]